LYIKKNISTHARPADAHAARINQGVSVFEPGEHLGGLEPRKGLEPGADLEPARHGCGAPPTRRDQKRRKGHRIATVPDLVARGNERRAR
jgi:hypothetical protein